MNSDIVSERGAQYAALVRVFYPRAVCEVSSASGYGTPLAHTVYHTEDKGDAASLGSGPTVFEAWRHAAQVVARHVAEGSI